jgi:catechol 2,3-dioxygenase-like lactoylglutathione lyase family enzyme
MPTSDVLARRFLHVNLNCKSLDATEELYGERLGLSVRMRTEAGAGSDGSIIGLEGEISGLTSFLYDARGGRGACAVEAIQWTSPAIKLDQNPDPARPGIRSALFTVNDLAHHVAALREAGFNVSDPVAGLISGGKSVLVTDPDGVVVELTEAPSEFAGALFSGIRISAVDAAATVAYMTAIGFVVLDAPSAVPVANDQLAPGADDSETECVVARLALAEDQHQFAVSVVQHPDAGNHPLPEGGNSQGLYRCALRVENVEKALAALPEFVELQGEPVWCPLPGTPLDGLLVAFMRSPDGIVFEFVERPLKNFTR